MEDLEGRTAIVTGGGTGIGEAISLALARLRLNVVVCGRRWEPLDTVVRAIRQSGGQALAVRGDVTVTDDVERVVHTAVETYGSIDILINNAGVGGGDPIHEHSIEGWDQVMAVNLRGPFLFARFVLPFMRKQRRGHVINVSSESGIAYCSQSGAYGVSKHALNALSEYMQQENQAYGIRVNTLCPGMVVTETTEDAVGLVHEKCLYPQDIADLVVWLVTRRANVKIGSAILIQTMENPWLSQH